MKTYHIMQPIQVFKDWIYQICFIHMRMKHTRNTYNTETGLDVTGLDVTISLPTSETGELLKPLQINYNFFGEKLNGTWGILDNKNYNRWKNFHFSIED